MGRRPSLGRTLESLDDFEFGLAVKSHQAPELAADDSVRKRHPGRATGCRQSSAILDRFLHVNMIQFIGRCYRLRGHTAETTKISKRARLANWQCVRGKERGNCNEDASQSPLEDGMKAFAELGNGI